MNILIQAPIEIYTTFLVCTLFSLAYTATDAIHAIKSIYGIITETGKRKLIRLAVKLVVIQVVITLALTLALMFLIGAIPYLWAQLLCVAVVLGAHSLIISSICPKLSDKTFAEIEVEMQEQL